MADARLAALTALEKCRRADAWSDAVLGSVMDSAGLDGRDRGLCTALCYGVQQQRLLLDYAIGSFTKLSKLEPKVLDILRLGAYQLMFMDRIPVSAAVNEAVKEAKKLGYARASGLVNAVLRRIAEAKDKLKMPEGKTRAETLSLRYSHPVELTEYFISLLGEAEAEKLLAAHNESVPAALQVNTVRTTAEELLARLTEAGADCAMHPYLPDCILLNSAGALEALPGYGEGEFYIQDPAAFMSVLAAAPKAGERVLDVCSAPGGKSFAAAVLSGGEAEIVSCDLHENKLKRIRESADRLGLAHHSCFAADGREFRSDFAEAFDLVIADVPCSGLGVIRKKPDIRYKDMSYFDELSALQLDILQNAARYVAPGGRLIYSTCTVRPEENGKNLRRFLAENGGFELERFTLPSLGECPGEVQLWPHIHGTDGFYFAKLRRKK